jgi:hypothetical protein
LTLSKRHTVSLPTTSGMTTQTLRYAIMTSPGYDQEMNGGSTTRFYSGLSVTSDSDGKSPHSAPATIEPQQRECSDGARLLAETGDIEAKKRDVIARTE